jgi:hypothetical protein
METCHDHVEACKTGTENDDKRNNYATTRTMEALLQYYEFFELPTS